MSKENRETASSTEKPGKKRPPPEKLVSKSIKKRIQDGGFPANDIRNPEDLKTQEKCQTKDIQEEDNSKDEPASSHNGKSTENQMALLINSINTLAQQQASGQSKLNATLKSMGDTIVSLKDQIEGPHIVNDEEENSEFSDGGLENNLNQLLAEAENNEGGNTNPNNSSGEKSQTEECDKLLQEIAGDFTEDTDIGPDINGKLASIINDAVSKKLGGEKIKELLGKYPRPKNCTTQVPKVNPEIWTKLPPPSKSRDIRMQKSQKHLEKSISSLSILADDILSVKTNKTPEKLDLNDTLRKLLDAITLVGLAQQELSLKRRELMKLDMNPEYRQLCSAQVPVTKLLFGDDLPKSIKDLNETNKVAGKLGFQNSRGKDAYANKGRNFLGQRRAQGNYQNKRPYQKQSQYPKWKQQNWKERKQ